jgi:Txe/YoeB family toxin of Txe-Axe toxin-antitoxin module
MDHVEKEGIVVFTKEGKEDADSRVVKLENGEEAYYALLASDMLQLSNKYKRDIDEVHKIFYEVSGKRDKLIKILEG